jgi:hypothetical protein
LVQILDALEDDAFCVSDDDEFEDMLYEIDGGSEVSEDNYQG